jgi:prepilin-type processing-associated H-X9-DG protein
VVHDAGNTNDGGKWALPAGRSLRWQDRLIEFVANIKGVNQYTDLRGFNQEQLQQASVLWGCPAYRLMDGWSNINPLNDVVRSGYAMQQYPLLPAASLNRHKAWITASSTGRYFKMIEWTKPSERLLVGEGLHHYIEMIPGMRPGPITLSHKWFPFENTGIETNWVNAQFTIDGSRHGRPGITKEESYRTKSMNALFCDGHAEPVSVKEAWQAIVSPGANTATP